MHRNCITRIVKHSFTVMIYDCIASKDLDRNCVINGNAQKCVNEILQSKMKLSTRDFPKNNEAFTFQKNVAHAKSLKCAKSIQIRVLEQSGIHDANIVEVSSIYLQIT